MPRAGTAPDAVASIVAPERSTAGPLISVCMLAGHGVGALDECLRSLGAQVAPPSFELLIGGDPSPEALSVVRRHFPSAQVCGTVGQLPGAARNPLIERARGELLLFLDDDLTVPSDLLRRLAETAAHHPKVCVFGGPNETPADSSRFQQVQGAVLASVVGSGPVCRRYGARHAGPADERWFTLCNLAVRREVMLPFLNDLSCAEENALLAELHRRGKEMRYDPELRVFHTRRPTPRSFAEQMLKYGRGRGELARRELHTCRAAYLAPAAFLLYLLALPLIVALGFHVTLLLLPALLYCALTIATALRVAWTLRRATTVAVAAVLIPTVHLCYGSGVLRGLFSPRIGGESRGRAELAAEQGGASAQPMVAPGEPRLRPSISRDSA